MDPPGQIRRGQCYTKQLVCLSSMSLSSFEQLIALLIWQRLKWFGVANGIGTIFSRIYLMETSLVITTYNRPEALDWVLASVDRQQIDPAQVIIADDGSKASNIDVIRRWSGRLPIVHVWQPDNEFRAARVRNLAVLKASNEHIIFIDADCVLPPDFVRQHQSLIESGILVSGGRFLMSENDTKRLLECDIPSTQIDFCGFKFRKIPLGPLRDLRKKSWKQVRTCNLGVLRRDILDVGGFDETFVGWGREDSDFVIRSIRSSMAIRSARFSACVKHLYHPEFPRSDLVANEAFLAEGFSSNRIVPKKSSLSNL